MSGRKPKPDEIKVLTGTFRADRTNPDKPKLALEIPMPPDWLSERAKEAYSELAGVLHNMKVITSSDRTALSLLCESYATYRECYEFIKVHGRTYRTGTPVAKKDIEGDIIGYDLAEGTIMYRAYPEVAIMNEAWKQCRSLLAEFGLTPSSRNKVSAIGEKEEDPFTAFLKK